MTAELLTEEDRRALIDSHGGRVGDILAVSYSGLSKYQQCGEAYKLQYRMHVPLEPQGSAIAGSVVHKIIEEMAVDRWFMDPGKVERVGAARFHEMFPEALVAEGATPVEYEGRVIAYEGVRWGGRKRVMRDERNREVIVDGKKVMVGEDYLWFMQTAPTWIKRAATILRNDIAAGTELWDPNIERRVSAWLDGPGSTLITGRIDVVLLQGDDGSWILRDWKTGIFSDPRQLANYAWLLQAQEAEHERLQVDFGEIAYLRGKDKESWLKRYDLRPWIPLVPRWFRDMVRGVEEEYFPQQPGMFCPSCWVRQDCSYGMTLG